MKRGDVVLIVAPGDLGKPRPAVIVQSDDLGDAPTTVLVCPMSSEAGAAQRLRPVVQPTEDNKLRVPSQIMTDKIIALRRDRIRAVIGHLDISALDNLNRALLIVLGLAQRSRPMRPILRRRRSTSR